MTHIGGSPQLAEDWLTQNLIQNRKADCIGWRLNVHVPFLAISSKCVLKSTLSLSEGHPNKSFHSLIQQILQFSSVQSLGRVRPFATPWIAARQASLSITNFRSSLKLMSIESVMPCSISSSVVPFSSCPQSLPASESFPTSQLFAWGGQSIGVSALASFLPKNTQD